MEFVGQGIQKLDSEQNTLCCLCDLDLDLMTLMYEHDLDILMLYPHVKNEVARTDRYDQMHYDSHIYG